jgi:hypothetical protein
MERKLVEYEEAQRALNKTTSNEFFVEFWGPTFDMEGGEEKDEAIRHATKTLIDERVKRSRLVEKLAFDIRRLRTIVIVARLAGCET